MNLWVKRTGQFLLAVLFLMSCEDDSFLLGFKNPNKQFNVRYHEITFTDDQTSVMLIDSLLTDHYAIADAKSFRFLLGQYDDPYFGLVTSEVYTQFLPPVTSQITETTLTYDSATIQLHLDFYYYGAKAGNSHLEKFAIHELTDTLSFTGRYYYNSSFGYQPTPVGEASINVRYFALRETGNPDTLLIKGRLDDEYAFRIFDYATQYDSLGDPVWRNMFKGLAIIPDINNKYILGVNPGPNNINIPASSLSRIAIYYHKGTGAATTDRFVRYLMFNPKIGCNSFNKISTQRTGDLAAMSQPYETYAPDNGLRVVQSGSPVVTKLDLSQYYDFIRGKGPDGEDSLKEILINSAELSIGIQPQPVDFPPPSRLILRVLKKVDTQKYLFMNGVIDEDSTAMSDFWLLPYYKYYVVNSDKLVSPRYQEYMELIFDKDEQRYVGHMGIFLQNLFDRKEVEVDVAYFAIYPSSPDMGKSVNRVIFKQEDIKLGIYYTKVNIPNLE